MPAQLLQSPCLEQTCICKIEQQHDLADADMRALDVQSTCQKVTVRSVHNSLVHLCTTV